MSKHAQARAALAANGVDLVDEDDAGRGGLGLALSVNFSNMR